MNGPLIPNVFCNNYGTLSGDEGTSKQHGIRIISSPSWGTFKFDSSGAHPKSIQGTDDNPMLLTNGPQRATQLPMRERYGIDNLFQMGGIRKGVEKSASVVLSDFPRESRGELSNYGADADPSAYWYVSCFGYKASSCYGKDANGKLQCASAKRLTFRKLELHHLDMMAGVSSRFPDSSAPGGYITQEQLPKSWTDPLTFPPLIKEIHDAQNLCTIIGATY